MKKSQSWLFILIVAIPVIILAFFFLLSGISIKELPWWTIIIPILILISPFLFLFAHRTARAKYNTSLQQKKRFLTVWGGYIIFFVILLVICYYSNYDFVWVMLFTQIGFLLFVFLLKFRLFFPKKSNEK